MQIVPRLPLINKQLTGVLLLLLVVFLFLLEMSNSQPLDSSRGVRFENAIVDFKIHSCGSVRCIEGRSPKAFLSQSGQQTSFTELNMRIYSSKDPKGSFVELQASDASYDLSDDRIYFWKLENSDKKSALYDMKNEVLTYYP